MSKRLVMKLGVMVATLAAVTLLQGCDDGLEVAGAWMPVGGGSLSGFVFGTATGVGGGVAGGSSQGATGATAGAVAAGAGGGGGQVSAGAGF